MQDKWPCTSLSAKRIFLISGWDNITSLLQAVMHDNLIFSALLHRFSLSVPGFSLQCHGMSGRTSYLQFAAIQLNQYWYRPDFILASKTILLDISSSLLWKRLITGATLCLFGNPLYLMIKFQENTFVLKRRSMSTVVWRPAMVSPNVIYSLTGTSLSRWRARRLITLC